MKYSWLLILLAPVILTRCNTSPLPGKLLSTGNLALQEYSIDISRNTVLVTKNGALLKIPKGSLTTGGGNTVTLEIKEAYSIQQMIQAGLVTQSNGEPLSSGGMIYINAKGGQDVKITQAIKVAVPADYLAEGMQLFKGQKDKNGNINWKEPVALPENQQLNSIQQGQVLFQGKCASCHAIGKDLTGPNLAHYLKRFAGEEEAARRNHFHFLYNYPSCSGGDATDLYSWTLRNMYGNMGTIFPDLPFNDLDKIYSYIQNESDKNDLPLPSHAYLKDCIDSCCRYTETVFYLQKKKEGTDAIKEKMIRDNGSMVHEEKEPTSAITNESTGTNLLPPVEEKVFTPDYNAEYYQFTIESFGWFNIDILLKGVNGVEESELFVRITGEYREKIKVYLVIPSVKVYVEGGPAERNQEEFAFYLKNGMISLPQNAKAYIMAVTETEESIAFALKEFSTTLKQEFDVSLNRSTKEEFNTVIGNIGFGGLGIKVADAKNAADIRKTNAELKNIDQELKNAEALKPKNCDCGRDIGRTDTIQKLPEKNKVVISDIIDQ